MPESLTIPDHKLVHTAPLGLKYKNIKNKTGGRYKPWDLLATVLKCRIKFYIKLFLSVCFTWSHLRVYLTLWSNLVSASKFMSANYAKDIYFLTSILENHCKSGKISKAFLNNLWHPFIQQIFNEYYLVLYWILSIRNRSYMVHASKNSRRNKESW